MWAQSLGWEDPLEEEMATHSSILAWEIPGTEEPGGLQPMVAESQTQLSDCGHTDTDKVPRTHRHRQSPLHSAVSFSQPGHQAMLLVGVPSRHVGTKLAPKTRRGPSTSSRGNSISASIWPAPCVSSAPPSLS